MSYISDIHKYERCEKLFWLSEKEPQSSVPFVYYHENIMELVKERLMLHEYYEGERDDDPMLAFHAMHKYSALVNAHFAFQGLRVKIPVLIEEDGQWILYFVSTSCFPKESEAQRMADTLSVLTSLSILIKRVYCIHVNADYVRQNILNVHELLVISEYLYNAKHRAVRTIAELIASKKRDIYKFLPKMETTLQKEEIPSIRSTICTRGHKCQYYNTCFPKPIHNTSILHLVQSSKKYALLEKGITDIGDVDIGDIEGTRHQYAQIMAARNQGLYMDGYAVKEWVDTSIQYPISYLDFEWITFAYPPYQNMKPYDVLVFQYSLHVEVEHNKALMHYEFLGKKDCREEFILHLLQHIPKTGSILVYNMDGAEKLRLQQLSEQFPKYKKELLEVCDRMVDLSLPFSTGNIYDNRMEGLFSLKKLVDVFSTHSYKNLDIQYGIDAVNAWRMLDHVDDEERITIQNALLTYCAMDTYAEVIVFHKILELLEQRGVCA